MKHGNYKLITLIFILLLYGFTASSEEKVLAMKLSKIKKKTRIIKRFQAQNLLALIRLLQRLLKL